MKKTILITGWLWYIWSHAVVVFEQAWYKTVIIDNLWNSSIKVLDWINNIIGYKPDFYEVDLRDSEKLEEIFKKYKFDWVIHFAWLKSVWESCEKPLMYFDNNLIWSIRLFELMEKYWVKNIIFSSSATVYNLDLKSPFIENDLVWNTTNPYWTTKFLIEKILEDLSKFSSFNVVNLRYFNPIWAHPSWIIWENPDWIPNNLLPFIMKVATWEIKKLQVFGDDYETIDWTWVRDYIDVNDLIEWHLLAYKKLTPPSVPPLPGEGSNKNWFFNVYNLWTWRWISVFEMIEASKKITWRDILYNVVERRNWDLAEVYCNPSKAENELWWKAKTSLDESLENSWRFYCK